ncbi:hypothetical protein Taro_006301 [Colocasia esculenta]|uniref:Uncharacterized protein n=1 Tax=Colocasia esculenta TaxID=4460 RepID=A0A843TS42_COLES|nr:hypothetical protein [Colocasia esculenta]
MYDLEVEETLCSVLDLLKCRHTVPKQPRWCSGKASSVDTTWASVDTLSQLGQKVFWELSLVSTLPGLVVKKNPWSRMGQGKSDGHPSYE